MLNLKTALPAAALLFTLGAGAQTTAEPATAPATVRGTAATPATAPAVPAAQPDAAAEDEAQKITTMSFKELWVSGGILMWILAAVSVFGLSVVFYLFWVLRDSQIAPGDLTASLVDAVQRADLTDARNLCASHPCQLSAIMLSAFDHLQHSTRIETHALRENVESEGIRQAQTLNSQVQILQDIGAIAPMLGLLGTVLGMLDAFGAVALDVASAKPVVLAAGVSKAIITTVFGLAIAIPAMAFYAYFRRRATARVAVLEAAAARIVTVLSGRFHT